MLETGSLSFVGPLVGQGFDPLLEIISERRTYHVRGRSNLIEHGMTEPRPHCCLLGGNPGSCGQYACDSFAPPPPPPPPSGCSIEVQQLLVSCVGMF